MQITLTEVRFVRSLSLLLCLFIRQMGHLTMTSMMEPFLVQGRKVGLMGAFAGTLNKSELEVNSGSTVGINLFGFRVDGKILVDYNNIGVDASGQDNHFHDQNFAVGNTDEVWSADVTGSNSTVVSGEFKYGSAEKAFDGSDKTAAWSVNGGTISFDLSAHSLSGNTRVLTSSANSVTVVDGGGSQTLTNSDASNPGWLDFGAKTGITTISSTSSIGQSGVISVVEVNGKILIDKNIQDTVLDTPMANYAVLETGKNGNLQESLVAPFTAGAASTQTLTSGKYYWEVTGYHNGNDAGAVGVLRANLSSGTFFTDNPSGVYYYSFTGNKYIDGTDTAYGDAWKGVGNTYTIGVALDIDNGKIVFYKDGVEQPEIDLPDNTNGWKAHSNYSSVSDSFDITCNFGQQPFIHTTHQLVTTGLYQTWEQWARTALGYALDRIAKLEQQRASDIETIAELRTQVESALARIGSIEADEVNDDASRHCPSG